MDRARRAEVVHHLSSVRIRVTPDRKMLYRGVYRLGRRSQWQRVTGAGVSTAAQLRPTSYDVLWSLPFSLPNIDGGANHPTRPAVFPEKWYGVAQYAAASAVFVNQIECVVPDGLRGRRGLTGGCLRAKFPGRRAPHETGVAVREAGRHSHRAEAAASRMSGGCRPSFAPGILRNEHPRSACNPMAPVAQRTAWERPGSLSESRSSGSCERTHSITAEPIRSARDVLFVARV